MKNTSPRVFPWLQKDYYYYRTMALGWKGTPYFRRYTVGSWFQNRRLR